MSAEEEVEFTNKFLEVLKDHLTFAPQVKGYVLHSEGRKAIVGFCNAYAKEKCKEQKRLIKKDHKLYCKLKRYDLGEWHDMILKAPEPKFD